MWERLVVAVYTRTPVRARRVAVRLLTPGYRVGVLAVVERPDGRVLLVDQPYVSGWSLPGGDLKRGESLAAGLSRELREEVGLHVEVAAPQLATQRLADGWVTFVTRIEVSEQVADTLRPCSAELSRVGWFAPDALPAIDDDAVQPLALVGVPTSASPSPPSP